MSETPTDPADVHTGTDRVELPAHEKELRKLWREVAEKGIERGVDYRRIVKTLFGDIDAVTAERDELATAHEFMSKQFATMQREKEHGWREAEKWEAKAEKAQAELAAANTRCAELEGRLDQRSESLSRLGEAYERRGARLDRVTARVTEIADAIQGDSGWEHDGGCEGGEGGDEANCFACIEHGLRAAVALPREADR